MRRTTSSLHTANQRARHRATLLLVAAAAIGTTLAMATLQAATLWAAPGAAPPRQEPAATLVITTPTPTATPTPPGPTPAAGAISPWTAPLAALAAGSNAAGDDTGAEGYVVQAGDTLLDAALELGLNVDEVGCVVRPEFAPETQPLVIGDRLLSLPEGLICVRTQAGDTVRSLAERYSIAPEAILSEPWNGLRVETAERTLVAPLDEALPGGRFVRVPAVDQASGAARLSSAPGGFVTWMLEQPAGLLPQQALATGGVRRPAALAPVAANWPYGSGIFLWPSYGFLTQGYSFDHRALDIAAPTGAPVTAADRGVVVRAGWNGQGYGNFVVIDHNIDFMTLYAHLDTILVAEGDVVAQGQVLGTVGTSGNSTGPHLHFELRDFGRLTNPLEYLAR